MQTNSVAAEPRTTRNASKIERKPKKVIDKRFESLTRLLRNRNLFIRRVIENERRTTNDDITRLYDIQPAILTERRRSSDIYLEPETAAAATTDVDSSLVIRTDDDDVYEETFESTTFRSQYSANLPGMTGGDSCQRY